MDLSQKIGPFPAYIWGALFGVVVVGSLYWQNMDKGTAAAVEESDNEPTNPFADIGDAIDGAFEPGTANGNAGGVPASASIDSNEAWAVRAVAHLVGRGTNPLTAQRAVAHYLLGSVLSTSEESLLNTAIAGIGQPPEGVEIAAAAPEVAAVYRRSVTGVITKTDGKGVTTTLTPGEYLNLGMPAFKTNLYPVKYSYKAKKNGHTTVGTIAKYYKTSVENLMIINRFTSIPILKTGQRIKVPR